MRGATLTDRWEAALSADRDRLRGAGERLPERFSAAIAVNAARLHDLSPLAVLARGYAIARTEEGAVVRSVAAVAPGDGLAVTVADGVIDCTVREGRPTAAATGKEDR